MRFGLAHRIMTDALALLGVLCLLTSGKLHPAVVVAVVVGMAIALGLPERFRVDGYTKLVSVVLPVVTLGLELGRFFLGADPIPLVIEFAALLQVMRLMTRRGAAHDHQVILLALLHLIAGTVLGGGLNYALSLVGFLVFTPGALVLSHLRREVEGNYRQGARDRTGMPVDVPRILRSRRVIDRGFLIFTCFLSLPVFAFTAVLFLLFPRVGFAWFSVSPLQPTRMVGFSDRVDLGGVGTLRSDPTLVLRVVPPDLGENPRLRRNLYLRGAVFDSYSGHSWARTKLDARHGTQSGNQLYLRDSGPLDFVHGWKMDLAPIEPAVVFAPLDAVMLRATDNKFRALVRPPLLTRGPHGEVTDLSTDQQGLTYELFFAKGKPYPEALFSTDAERYLALPENLDERVRELSLAWASGASEPEAIARIIEQKLQTNYRYDLSSPSGKAKDPLADFLFVSKRGHCEFYSTAMALMLRTLGIPTRNVTGFVGGTYNRFGNFYAVRQGDAHSWVEAYLPREGWTRFDPTPPAQSLPRETARGFWATMREMMEAAAQSWEQNVVSFDMEKQIRIFRSVAEVFRSDPREKAEGERGKRGGTPKLDKRAYLLIGGGVAVLIGIGIYLARRKTDDDEASLLAPSAQRSIELYRRLERLLGRRGVPRPPGVPPLSHARALETAGHPLGEPSVRLTELYLRARFGGVPLTALEEAEFSSTCDELERRADRTSEAA